MPRAVRFPSSSTSVNHRLDHAALTSRDRFAEGYDQNATGTHIATCLPVDHALAHARFVVRARWCAREIDGTLEMPPHSNRNRSYQSREMSMHARIVPLVAFALAAFLTTASSAYAETLKFKANMDAAQEVPPNDSKGKGTADLTYDTTSKNLTWTITFDGLTGPATAAHFHGPAEPGKTAGVALLIGQNPTSPVRATPRLRTRRPRISWLAAGTSTCTQMPTAVAKSAGKSPSDHGLGEGVCHGPKARCAPTRSGPFVLAAH